MIRATGPDSLLVIVPAFNEAGAIGQVVRSIHEQTPGVPVLVIDDCSLDATVASREQSSMTSTGTPGVCS